MTRQGVTIDEGEDLGVLGADLFVWGNVRCLRADALI